MGRDSHKSSFDGLFLSGKSDGVVLPVRICPDFYVPVGMIFDNLKIAIEQYGNRVSIYYCPFSSSCCFCCFCCCCFCFVVVFHYHYFTSY